MNRFFAIDDRQCWSTYEKKKIADAAADVEKAQFERMFMPSIYRKILGRR